MIVDHANLSGARRVLRNSVVLGLANLIQRATGFVVALLVAGELGVDGLGVYAAASAVYGLIAIAGDAGATEYLIREISRDPARTATYTVLLSVVSLAVATALMIAAQLAVPHLGYSQNLATSVSIVLLAILPRVVNTIQEAVFVAHGRVEFEAFTRFVTSAGYLVAVVWLLREGFGVPALLRVFVASEYVVAVTYFFLINRAIDRLRLHVDWAMTIRLVRDMKWFTASTGLAALFSRPEIILMTVLASEREIGLYSAAIRLVELPLLFAEVFARNVFPLLARAFENAEDRFAAWQDVSVRAVLAFSLPVAACLVGGAEPILSTLYGARFEPAATVLRMLAVNVVCFSLMSVLWRSLAARGQQRANVMIQVGMVIVRLVGGAALIAPLAAVGAAIISAASGVLQMALLAQAVARSGVPPGVLRVGWRFAVSAAVAGLAVWLLTPGVFLAAALVAAGLVYLVLTFVAGGVTKEDRRQLRIVLTRRRAGV